MKILAPIDGSDCSFEALRFAIDFARRYGASLHVVHVTDHRTEATEALLSRASSILDEADVEDVPEVVTEMRKFRVSSHVGDHIVEIARKDGYDHVVMGHHGTGRAGRALLGSACQTVLEANAVPVTVVPEPDE